jgi:hypothetical protein
MLIGVILDSSPASGNSFYLHGRKLDVADQMTGHAVRRMNYRLPGIQIARRADHVAPITGGGALAVAKSILTFEFEF